MAANTMLVVLPRQDAMRLSRMTEQKLGLARKQSQPIRFSNTSSVGRLTPTDSAGILGPDPTTTLALPSPSPTRRISNTEAKAHCENDEEMPLTTESAAVDYSEPHAKVSFHAITGTIHPQTLRLPSKIKNKDVVVLIDGGSTHNFIDHALVDRFGLIIDREITFEVIVGNREKEICPGRVKELLLIIQGVAVDHSKVQAVLDWPTPKNAKGVRGVLGLARYYQKFIQHFGTMAALLHKLSLARVKESFWWFGINEGVKRFIQDCHICQRFKTKSCRPASLLQPLPIPFRIWEDISMDFIEGLPPSNEFTTIMVVVDRLSKIAHFVLIRYHLLQLRSLKSLYQMLSSCMAFLPQYMKRGFLSQKESGRGRDVKEQDLNRNLKNTSLGIGVSTDSDDTMNVDTPSGGASAVQEGVTPFVVDMMGEVEKQNYLDDNTVLESFPPLSMSITTKACSAPVECIHAISDRLANTEYGFFLGKRVAYPVVANYVRNTWGKYGLVRSIFSSSNRLFSFQFSSMDILDAMLENGPWLSFARVMIDLRVNVELKDNIVMAMPKITRQGHYTCNVHVEYEWKPPRCSSCKVLRHIHEECPIHVLPNASSSGNKKKGVEPTLEVSNSNPFDVLNSVDHDAEFGTNRVTTNLVNNKATSSGSSFMNIDNNREFACNTPISEKIDKIERQICEGKLRLLDNDGNPLVPTCIVESDSEVEVRNSYLDNDDYDPYDDDMYKNHDLSEHLQSICDDIDITVRECFDINCSLTTYPPYLLALPFSVDRERRFRCHWATEQPWIDGDLDHHPPVIYYFHQRYHHHLHHLYHSCHHHLYRRHYFYHPHLVRDPNRPHHPTTISITITTTITTTNNSTTTIKGWNELSRARAFTRGGNETRTLHARVGLLEQHDVITQDSLRIARGRITRSQLRAVYAEQEVRELREFQVTDTLEIIELRSGAGYAESCFKKIHKRQTRDGACTTDMTEQDIETLRARAETAEQQAETLQVSLGATRMDVRYLIESREADRLEMAELRSRTQDIYVASRILRDNFVHRQID
nr:transposon Ty3-G Gag-Pol polyprotein [Tanacetum cinerariifolium]